jgi:hypothetical protein
MSDSIDELARMYRNTECAILRRQIKTVINRMIKLKLEICRPSPNNLPFLSQAERQYLNDRQKLNAVKNYRNRTGKSLMDSKRDIEDYMVHHYGCKTFSQP